MLTDGSENLKFQRWIEDIVNESQISMINSMDRFQVLSSILLRTVGNNSIFCSV